MSNVSEKTSLRSEAVCVLTQDQRLQNGTVEPRTCQSFLHSDWKEDLYVIQTPSWPWKMVGIDPWYNVYDGKSQKKSKLVYSVCVFIGGFFLREMNYSFIQTCVSLYILFVNLGTCLNLSSYFLKASLILPYSSQIDMAKV